MLDILALAALVLAGLFLLLLGLAMLLAPVSAGRFLLGFAGSATVHYLEMSARLAVGGALIWRSADMAFAQVLHAFGWVIVATTAVLLVVPWRWHRAFAQRVVPPVLRFSGVIGLVAIALGGLLLLALCLAPR
jgi:hypothetical protein